MAAYRGRHLPASPTTTTGNPASPLRRTFGTSGNQKLVKPRIAGDRDVPDLCRSLICAPIVLTIIEHELDLPAHQIGQRGDVSLCVRHMDPSFVPVSMFRYSIDRCGSAGARRAVAQLARIKPLRIVDQLLDGIERRIDVGHQGSPVPRWITVTGAKILDRIERHLLHRLGFTECAAITVLQGVMSGAAWPPCRRHRSGFVGAGLVVVDHRLPERATARTAHRTGYRVGITARRTESPSGSACRIVLRDAGIATAIAAAASIRAAIRSASVPAFIPSFSCRLPDRIKNRDRLAGQRRSMPPQSG